ncbi:hypothetical protein RFI_31688, partial [Reticulomyxa filosa]
TQPQGQIKEEKEKPETQLDDKAKLNTNLQATFDAHRHRKNREEGDIDPFSIGGIAVVLLSSLAFYIIYKMDQTDWNNLDGNRLWKGKVLSLEDYLQIKQSRKEGLHIIPDNWGVGRIVWDHFKNKVLGVVYWIKGEPKNTTIYYNSESLISKLWRLIHTPNAQLLPPIKQQFAGRTLALDLHTVCHVSWSRTGGITRVMRPFYKEMITRAAMAGWEIVLFSTDEDIDWMESPDFPKLDEMGGMVSHYLWRKDCYYFNGHHCKDLSRLDRSLNRVLVIDSDPRNVQMFPENAIIINKWDPSNPNDEELRKLFIFLDFLQKADVHDIRGVLENFRGKDIGNEFQQKYQLAIQGR